MYPEQLVIPMKEELTENGFSELKTPEEVIKSIGIQGHNPGSDKFGLRLFCWYCEARSTHGCSQYNEKT